MPTTLVAPRPVVKFNDFPDFGKYLTYAEAVKSDTAIRHGIRNVPTPAQYDNIKRVYDELFLPLCRQFGKKRVNSLFRSKALNTAVNGSKTSAHMDGLAIDVDCDGIEGITNKELYKWLRNNRKTLKFDQIIQEFPDTDGNPGWIHIAFRAVGWQRQMSMRAVKKDGQVFYIYE